MDYQYVAGFFDGEGSIFITKTRNGKYGNGKYYYPIVAALYQKHRDILQRIGDHMGVPFKIHCDKRGGGHGYFLRWTGANAIAALKLLFPYLIIKHDQALVAMDAFSHVGPGERALHKEALTLLNHQPFEAALN